MNLFTVHTKNGLSIYRCTPSKTDEKTYSTKEPNSLEEEKPEIVNNFKIDCVWEQDRSARHCLGSHNNYLAVVDDRSGLSIVQLKARNYNDLSADTLRGVGKYKNMYTPMGCKNIKHLQWSNNGTYLIVYFNLSAYSESGICLEDNLHIWDISKKNIIGTFSTKRISPEQWPVIKWMGQTDNFVFSHNHQINIYSIVSEVSIKTIKLLMTIHVPMVFTVETYFQSQDNSMTMREGNVVNLASFSQTDTNKTSGILRISKFQLKKESLEEIAYNIHELKYADSAELLWSPSGRYLMVLAQSTVDVSGEKYGSTTNCMMYSSEGKFINKVNEATTHDARWNPKKDEFIILQGNMPCKTILYNVNLEILFQFPSMYRNTIKWNPMGNMVALGGFGNLAGEISFWYKNQETEEMEQIVQFKEPCTVLSDWSPDSRYFMTASTFPRMKVDNFFKIFNCEGYLISKQKLEECYGVYWICGNEKETEFIRPRQRKLFTRKSLYKPKLPIKTNKLVDNTNYSRAPGSPIFNNIRSNQSSQTSTPRNSFKSFDVKHYRDKQNNSFFSNQYGNTCDPTTDLFHSFKHVFSLSFIMNQNNQNPYQTQNQDFQNHQRQEIYSDEFYRHNFLTEYDENMFQQPMGNTYPQFSEVPRMSYNEIRKPSFREDHLNRVPDRQRQNYQESTNNFPREEIKNNPSIKNNISMFIKLKNQLQQERNKNSQQSIMDEGQLLRLLLEAKNRQRPN